MRRSTQKTTSGSSSRATARPVRETLSAARTRQAPANARSNPRATGTLGISAYAANALGDVVYVELPELELEVGQGDAIGAVESVKSASDIMTPVSGKVAEANKALEEKPGNLNQDPEGEAWIAKIEIKDSEELKDLMDAQAYKAFTEE